MLKDILRSLRLTALSIAVCVFAYSSVVLAVAMVFAPEARQGSLLIGNDGQIVGSRLLAQAFHKPEYLWPRPSAVDYNAGGAGGSNLSPTNPKIRERAQEIIASYDLADGARLPAELATTSGSGLDPHITLEAGLVQADRIATTRQIDVAKVRELLRSAADRKILSIGQSEGLINVLEFNLLLDTQGTVLSKSSTIPSRSIDGITNPVQSFVNEHNLLQALRNERGDAKAP